MANAFRFGLVVVPLAAGRDLDGLVAHVQVFLAAEASTPAVFELGVRRAECELVELVAQHVDKVFVYVGVGLG